MLTSTYAALRSSVSQICAAQSSLRAVEVAKIEAIPSTGFLPSLDRSHFAEQLHAVWEGLWTGSDLFANGSSTSQASASGHLEVVRAWMELSGRDMVVGPIVEGELVEAEEAKEQCLFLSNLQDRLDVVLTLYEVVHSALKSPILEPGALFIPLIEELIEILSMETWRQLWYYAESRAERYSKDMPASRGKALPFLRIINTFLRSLPRTPEDLVFRGRVHQLASSVISIADKSAINLRGDYGVLETTWEEAGDEEMEESEKEVDGDFYTDLWSLQQYFSNPPLLDGRSEDTSALETFKRKTDSILPVLFAQTTKERAIAGADDGSRKRKRDDTPDQHATFFHPRYLTGRRLITHELADVSFRRQILVQYFILFQFLLNLTPGSAAKQAFTGGMPKTFVLLDADQEWVRKKVQGIKEELRRMGKDGRRFEESILSIITRERYYAQWKNDGCPEKVFEVDPMDATSAEKAAELWEKRSAPPQRYPFRVGSRALSMLWRGGYEGSHQLKGWKRSSTLKDLEAELAQLKEAEEDDKAMGREPTEEEVRSSAEVKTKLTWRATRLAARSDLKMFKSIANKRDISILTSAIKTEEERLAALAAASLAVSLGGVTPSRALRTGTEDVATPPPSSPKVVEAEAGKGDTKAEVGKQETSAKDGLEVDAPVPVEGQAEVAAESEVVTST